MNPTQVQNYKIQPAGKIKGGTAKYSLDAVSGEIVYSSEVVAGFWFFTKTLHYGGTIKVDPALLRSSNYRQVGPKPPVGILNFEVTSVSPNFVSAKLSITGKPMSGTAVVDTTHDFIQPLALNARATVSGFDIQLRLVVAP